MGLFLIIDDFWSTELPLPLLVLLVRKEKRRKKREKNAKIAPPKKGERKIRPSE